MTLREMMQDPRYWRDRDPEFCAAVSAAFRALVETPRRDEKEPTP